jgi:hypothetical protein
LDERAQLASASVSDDSIRFDSRIEHRSADQARCIFAQTDCKIRCAKGGPLIDLNWASNWALTRRAT